MSQYVRSGMPMVVTVPSGGGPAAFVSETTAIYVAGAAGTTLYFTRNDFDAKTNGIKIPDSGVFEGPACLRYLWVDGSADVTVLGYCLGR